jgi:hypothetical protein
MRRFSAALLALLALLSLAPRAAEALSCAAPTMNRNVIEGAAIIFEGVVGQERALKLREKVALSLAGFGQLGGGMADLRVFVFTVTKAWKGTVVGAQVRVLRNTYWGDSFAATGAYLVVAEQEIGDLYPTRLCGNTMARDGAERSGVLETLEELIGPGSQAP